MKTVAKGGFAMKLRNVFGVLLLMLAESAFAGGQELAMKNNCMGCHTVDKKLVGPAY